MRTNSEFIRILKSLAPEDGIHEHPAAGIGIIRSSVATLPVPVLYRPTVCFVAQGAKEVKLDDRYIRYDASNFLLGALDVPVLGAVVEASPDHPFLCVRMDIDLLMVAELAAQTPDQMDPPGAEGLTLGATTPELVDAFARLVTLLKSPCDRDALSPLVSREIIWRILVGPSGDALRQICTTNSRLANIQRSIKLLGEEYRRPITIEELASAAGMSPSTFHQHFKSVVGTTPVNYRARLRLMEAQRLMLVDGHDAADAGFAVGYGSPSQFSREYARLYGTPPAKDVARIRDGLSDPHLAPQIEPMGYQTR